MGKWGKHGKNVPVDSSHGVALKLDLCVPSFISIGLLSSSNFLLSPPPLLTSKRYGQRGILSPFPPVGFFQNFSSWQFSLQLPASLLQSSPFKQVNVRLYMNLKRELSILHHIERKRREWGRTEEKSRGYKRDGGVDRWPPPVETRRDRVRFA